MKSPLLNAFIFLYAIIMGTESEKLARKNTKNEIFKQKKVIVSKKIQWPHIPKT